MPVENAKLFQTLKLRKTKVQHFEGKPCPPLQLVKLNSFNTLYLDLWEFSFAVCLFVVLFLFCVFLYMLIAFLVEMCWNTFDGGERQLNIFKSIVLCTNARVYWTSKILAHIDQVLVFSWFNKKYTFTKYPVGCSSMSKRKEKRSASFSENI